MKQIQFAGPAHDASRTSVVDVPEPIISADELLIDVEHAGLNFKDIMVRRGDASYAPAWPVSPGLEVAGRVHAVGANVSGLHPGQRVAALTNMGGLSEQVAVDAALVVPVPDEVGLDLAATVPGVWATAWLLLRRMPHGARRIVVHSAAGGIGQAVARLARLHGQVELIGLVGDEGRVPAARRWGYDQVHLRDDDWPAAIGEATVDLVLDPHGTRNVPSDLRALIPGGTVVLFGDTAGDGSGSLPPSGQLMGANAALAGFSIQAMSMHRPQAVRMAMAEVLQAMRSGRITLEIEAVGGLAAVGAAHDALANGRGPGKFVVRV